MDTYKPGDLANFLSSLPSGEEAAVATNKATEAKKSRKRKVPSGSDANSSTTPLKSSEGKKTVSKVADFFEKSRDLFRPAERKAQPISAALDADEQEAAEKRKKRREEKERAAAEESVNGKKKKKKDKKKKKKMEQNSDEAATDKESSAVEKDEEEGAETTQSKKESKKATEEAESEEEGEEEVDNLEGTEEEEERTVFVGNLSVSVKKKAIMKFFRQFGKVVSCRLRSVAVMGTKVDRAGNQKLVKKISVNKGLLNPNRDTMNAYVVFATKEEAEKALGANNMEFEGKHLRVDKSKPTVDAKRSLFLGNLPFDISEEAVRAHFAEEIVDGNDAIVNVRLIRDNETGMGKGFGYILFKDKASIPSALQLHESKLAGRTIRVTTCGKRMKQKQQQGGKGRRAQIQGSSTVGRTSGRGSSFEGQRAVAAPGAARRIQGKLKKPRSGGAAASAPNKAGSRAARSAKKLKKEFTKRVKSVKKANKKKDLKR